MIFHFISLKESSPLQSRSHCVQKEKAQSTLNISVVQWFSAFLMLQPFNTVPHAVMTLDQKKLVLLLLPNCNIAIVIDHNVITDMQDICSAMPVRVLTCRLRTTALVNFSYR